MPGDKENKSTEKGRLGEDSAEKHLVGTGFKILERNWRYRKYEVDIIAKKGDILVFVEVKTRKNNIFGEPEVFVTRRKQQFLIAAANQYIRKLNLPNESRFDIISIVMAADSEVVTHIEGAFHPLVR